MRKRLQLFLPALFLSLCLQSQIYPVAIVTSQKNSASLFLDELAHPFKPVISASIFLRDLTAGTATCKLKLTINGPGGLRLQTHYRSAQAPILQLSSAAPLVVEGAELAWYLQSSNLDFTNLDKNQFETSKRLPEGNYSIAIEALDFETGLALSLPSTINLYLSLSDPPLIVTPACGTVIENTSMQNIFFQWQVANPSAITNFSELRYKINLYEVNNDWSNPTNAIANNQAIIVWQSQAFTNTSYLYTMAEPPLERGRRYVYTITASSADGRSRFKNQGTSTPCFFHFGYYEGDTIKVTKPLQNFQFALSTPSEFHWQKPAHALPNQLVKYSLRLVAIQAGQTATTALQNNTPFYLQEYLPVTNSTIAKTIPPAIWTNVKRMGRYAWQVVAHSGTQEVARSPVMEFTGPPAIETFIAGGFVMTITKLSAYDTITKVVSGTCKTFLNPAHAQTSEFKFNNITLTSIGNNEWVLSAGKIADKVLAGSYTLQAQDSTSNGLADFRPDSILVNTSGLWLSGKINWYLPHATLNAAREIITSAQTQLKLSNGSFLLMGSYPATLQKEYRCELVDPYGFSIRLSKTSAIGVYQNKYTLYLRGFVQLPPNVRNSAGNGAHIAFQDISNLHYIYIPNNNNSEGIRLQAGSQIEFKPSAYYIDFSDTKNPTEFSNTSFKGIYFTAGNLQFGSNPDAGKQLRFPALSNYSVTNTPNDLNLAHVTTQGLFLKTGITIANSDSLRFNNFVARNNRFVISTTASNIDSACLRGGIQIPFIDTLQTFPFQINLTQQGFTEGYLTKGLANHSFTFNAQGGAEQKVKLLIKRALFAAHDRLLLDVDMTWMHFDLFIQDVQGITVWGNGNLGITVPNGKAAVNYQCKGKAGNYPITVDFLGCGRNGNAYAIGASAQIVFDQEFSGEDGPPKINAYSICKNPLLSGTVTSAPIASATTSGSTVTNSYVSSTSSYTAAANANLSTAMMALGVNAGDTTQSKLSLQAQNATPKPILNASAMLQLKEIVELIYRLKPYIATKAVSDKDWRTLDRLKTALEADEVQKAQVMNAKELLNYLLNKVVESLVARSGNGIQSLSDQGMAKMRSGINGLVAQPVNKKIDAAFKSLENKLNQNILPKVDDTNDSIVSAVIKLVLTQIAAEIKYSVSNSVEDNLISPLSNFVQIAVTSKVKTFVESEVRKAAEALIQNGVKTELKLNLLAQNTGSLLSNIADTIKEAVLTINGQTFVRSAESLVDDAIAGIDWGKIAQKILSELVKKGLSQVVVTQVTNLFSNSAGPYAQALLSNVQFDFSNLGSKLKNGEFDKIVKFDPTNIYIVTPAADIRGSLRFKKGDSIFGDCWRADVMLRLKAPKKDNPVECSAAFLTGKTGANAGSFNYWYAKLAVMGFDVPLSPAPVIWDGVEGFAFSRMKKTNSTTVVPDATNKFGLGCKFYFSDQSTKGKTYLFDLGAEATFEQGGFAIELVGNASAFHTNKVQGNYQRPGFITGSGSLGYYKTPQSTKIAGNFTVKLNTEPVLCAGGAMGLDLKSPHDWRVWLGTQQQPLGVKVLCKDFLSNTAWLQASNSGFSAALNMNVNLSARTPWIEAGTLKFRASAVLQAGYAINTSVEWEPSFKIKDASFAIWLNAALGVEYQTPAGTTSLTLAGVAMSGQLSYKSAPEAELHGELAGSITLAGYGINFKAPVHYSLSKQQIIN